MIIIIADITNKITYFIYFAAVFYISLTLLLVRI
jgi:hypothetical protein